jgi:ATP-dependent helicase/nuclease subunit A
LERIYEDTGILQIVSTQIGGRQKLGNLQKLLQIAYTYQREKQFGLTEFVMFLGRMVEQEVDETDADVTSLDEDVVKIMTIHQSKGLEFPVVILPDLARQPRTDHVTFLYHSQMGLGLKFNLSERHTGSGDKEIPLDGSGVMHELLQEVSDRAKQEERRKLYVAMTRARDYLILVGCKKEAQKEYGKALSGANWLDWVTAIVTQEQATDISIACEQFGIRYLTPELLEERWSARASDRIQVTLADDPVDNDFVSTTDSLFLDAIPLQMPNQTQQAADKQSLPHAYLTATMVVDQADNPLRFKRCYEMGLPDWEEWETGRAGHSYQQAGRPSKQNELVIESSLSPDTLGTIVHKVCELLVTKEQVLEVTQQVLAQFGMPNEVESKEFQSVWELVERYSNSDVFRQICSASSVQSEVPFRVVLDGQEFTGIIDKLITDQDGNVTVIDFKTNHVNDQNRAILNAKYQPQLDLYKRALETILRKPVQTKLVFVRDL